jgi:multiple sugar transport system permease protein
MTFVSGYTLFLLVFGILPTIYAVYLAFTKANAFVGIDNFVKVFNDFRFLPALGHVGLYVVVWVLSLIMLVVLLALIVHGVRARWISTSVRFIYYIPGALAGASSVMLWLFVLDPTVSPVSFLLHALGNDVLTQPADIHAGVLDHLLLERVQLLIVKVKLVAAIGAGDDVPAVQGLQHQCQVHIEFPA